MWSTELGSLSVFFKSWNIIARLDFENKGNKIAIFLELFESSIVSKFDEFSIFSPKVIEHWQLPNIEKKKKRKKNKNNNSNVDKIILNEELKGFCQKSEKKYYLHWEKFLNIDFGQTTINQNCILKTPDKRLLIGEAFPQNEKNRLYTMNFIVYEDWEEVRNYFSTKTNYIKLNLDKGLNELSKIIRGESDI